MESAQDLDDLLAGLDGVRMGFETVAEVPRLVIKIRVVPGKEFNHAVPQNEIVVITVAWLPALGVLGGRSSSSRHGATTPCGNSLQSGQGSYAECP